MNLSEKYRPQTLNDVWGQDDATALLRCVLKNGWAGRAFWISGDSGTGKTTLARIIALQIAEDWFVQEYDSADALNKEALAQIEQACQLYAPGKGGRAIIVNEAHGLRKPIIRQLLGLLERIPSHVVWVFTTTKAGMTGLFDDQIDAEPLMSRCVPVELATDGLDEVFAWRCKQIAEAEGLDGSPLGDYIQLAHDCKNNCRAMLQAVESGKMKRKE
jgi:DNA polymerase-3 subunit gamma/tau